MRLFTGNTLSFIFLIMVFFIYATLDAQYDSTDILINDTLAISYDFFEDEDPFNCTMKFDIKFYQRKKYEGNYLPVIMTYYDIDSIPVEKNFRIKARGNFRREHCGLPPLWLNIKKADLKSEQFQDVKKMKVVTHCRGGKSYNQYVLKEYLAYKIYNLISPYSFRVRLAEIKYIDTGRKNKTYTYWAFIIEPESMMTERLNSIFIKADNLGIMHTDSLATDIISLFQYMIGNGDYSISGRHNIKLIKENDPYKFYPIPVPYDFDYAGLVNAYYAVPGETLGIKSVTERYYLGPCRTEQEYKKALSVIIDQEDTIISLVNKFPYLKDRDKNEMLNYLKSFFERSKQKGFISYEIHSTCRKPSTN